MTDSKSTSQEFRINLSQFNDTVCDVTTKMNFEESIAFSAESEVERIVPLSEKVLDQPPVDVLPILADGSVPQTEPSVDLIPGESLKDVVSSEQSVKDLPIKHVKDLPIEHEVGIDDVIGSSGVVLPSGSMLKELNTELPIEDLTAVVRLQVVDHPNTLQVVEVVTAGFSDPSILPIPPSSQEDVLSTELEDIRSPGSSLDLVPRALPVEILIENSATVEHESRDQGMHAAQSLIAENHTSNDITDSLLSDTATVCSMIDDNFVSPNPMDQSKVSTVLGMKPLKMNRDNKSLGSPIYLQSKRDLRRSSQADVTINLCGQKLVQLYTIDIPVPVHKEDEIHREVCLVAEEMSINPRRPQVAVRGGYSSRARFRGTTKTYHQPRQMTKTDSETSETWKLCQTSSERFSEEAGLFSDQPSTIIRIKISEMSEDSDGDDVNKSSVSRSKISPSHKRFQQLDNEDDPRKNTLPSNSNTINRGGKTGRVNKNKDKYVSDGLSSLPLDEECGPIVAGDKHVKDVKSKGDTHKISTAGGRVQLVKDAKNKKEDLKMSAGKKTKVASTPQLVRKPVPEHVSVHDIASLQSNNETLVASDLMEVNNGVEISQTKKSKSGQDKPRDKSEFSAADIKATYSMLVQNANKTAHRQALQNFEVHNQIERLKKGTVVRSSTRVGGFEKNSGKATTQIPRDRGNNTKTKDVTKSVSGLKRKSTTNSLSGPASFKRRRILEAIHQAVGPASFKARVSQSPDVIMAVASFGLKDRQAATAFVCQSHQNYCDGWKVGNEHLYLCIIFSKIIIFTAYL